MFLFFVFLTGAGLRIWLALQKGEQPCSPPQGGSPVAVIPEGKEKQTRGRGSDTREVASSTLSFLEFKAFESSATKVFLSHSTGITECPQK